MSVWMSDKWIDKITGTEIKSDTEILMNVMSANNTDKSWDKIPMSDWTTDN